MNQQAGARKSTHRRHAFCASLTVLTFWASTCAYWVHSGFHSAASERIPPNAQKVLGICDALNRPAGPPPDFALREGSDRFEDGTPATVVRNATIFTGARSGTEIVRGDILLDRGIVKALGVVPHDLLTAIKHEGREVKEVGANGAWVTPGLVDLHSHIGLLSAPFMSGTMDVNSAHGPVLPWLRSIDGFNTHDDAIELAIAGGVTSIQALPGSGNAIGGQAFMLKLRPTKERSPTSMLLEPPHSLNDTHPLDPEHPPRWRHMKQACGENLIEYGTRMDTAWSFRQAYNEAKKVKDAQDAYCTHARAGTWSAIAGKEFPESLQWEMLVDVLRGRVKISNHCYEPVDLDNIVRLTNEFEFPLATFHHASGAYLVPDVLKKAWGGPPAIAIFATNHRYKRESYRGSEFAPRILADNGIPVVMKTDHPVINDRDLLFEAQQAHYFGLPPHLALASVTSVPATAAGLSHRIGILGKGSDADIVLWNSHPLRLGATPRMVWIDGKRVLSAENATAVEAGLSKTGSKWLKAPVVPNWDKERKETVAYEGLPPLDTGMKLEDKIVFKHVKEVWLRSAAGVYKHVTAASKIPTNDATHGEFVTAVVFRGQLVCAETGVGACKDHMGRDLQIVDLAGGSILPALMTFGSPLGLEEIAGDASTGGGPMIDPLTFDVPSVVGDVGAAMRAVDGLVFSTRNALTAYRSGVTLATTSLAKINLFSGPNTVFSGLSTTFRTGAAHALKPNSVLKEVTALHVAIGRTAPYASFEGAVPSSSVSSRIATLRRLLLGDENKTTETGYWFAQAAEGAIPIVIDVGSADIMTTLIELKHEVEAARGSQMNMVFARATEAHLISQHIAKANIGVILIGSRQFPETWDDRRILPGPPLTNDTALVALLEAGVTVGVGVREAWNARNTFFDVAWAALASNGRISYEQALDLSSTNLEKLLRVDVKPETADLVAFAGGDIWDLEGRPTAIISPQNGFTEIL